MRASAFEELRNRGPYATVATEGDLTVGKG
jgi:hypothetical protein